MSTLSLQQQIARTAAATIAVAPGEHEGPIVIERPLRLVGGGAASVIWARRGPVVTVRAGGVSLEGLAIELTERLDEVALLIEGPALRRPPTLSRLRVLGGVAGGPQLRWQIPPVIDFGELVMPFETERTYSLQSPGPVTVRPGLAGLTVRAQPVEAGLLLRIAISSEELLPGALLDGHVEIESAGISSLVRLTGQIAATAERPAADQRSLLDRRFQPVPPSAPPAPSAERLAAEAAAALQAGELERAADLFGRAADAAPGRAELRARLAELQWRRGQIGAATSAWEAVVRDDRGYPGALGQLARCYNQVKEYARTIGLLEPALARPAHQGDAELYSALAMAYHASGRLPEALWALEKAQAISPDRRRELLLRSWRREQEG